MENKMFFYYLPEDIKAKNNRDFIRKLNAEVSDSFASSMEKYFFTGKSEQKACVSPWAFERSVLEMAIRSQKTIYVDLPRFSKKLYSSLSLDAFIAAMHRNVDVKIVLNQQKDFLCLPDSFKDQVDQLRPRIRFNAYKEEDYFLVDRQIPFCHSENLKYGVLVFDDYMCQIPILEDKKMLISHHANIAQLKSIIKKRWNAGREM